MILSGMQSIACVMLISLLVRFSDGIEVNLDGLSYIKYDMLKTKEKIFALSETLSLRFKTLDPSGLLFYAHGLSWQYVSLELFHGKLRYTVNLGTRKSMPFTMTFGDQLCDNKWHNVRVMRGRDKLHIHLDTEQKRIVVMNMPEYDFRHYLTVDMRYYVGGTWKTKNEYGLALTKNFVGCLSDVLFNAYHPISDVKRNRSINGYEVKGNIVFKCLPTEYTPVGFLNNFAFLRIPTQLKDEVSVSLTFRTYDQNGILMYRDGSKVSTCLYLKDGTLKFDFVVHRKTLLSIGTESFVHEPLNDGAWHTVKASVDAHFMAFDIDNYDGVNTSSHNLQLHGSTILDFENKTYIGGGIYYREMYGFVGCMRDIYANGERVDLKNLATPVGIDSSFVTKRQCTLTSLCHPSQCRYESRCIQELSNFTCKCKAFYDGRFCEIPLFQATCQGYKELGMKKDAYCIVDPDHVGPLPEFRILCNMTADKDAVSVVNHTMDTSSIRVKDAMRYSNARKSWLHMFKYGVDAQNLRALVDESDYCRQYVQFDCINTTFSLHGNNKNGMAWFTTDGTERYYWGGATIGSGACACAQSSSCYKRNKPCNCDTGDAVWRQDAGYITRKADLPVMGIYFPHSANLSNFSVGPLECFGRKKQLSRNTGKRKYFDIACQPLVTTPPPNHLWRKSTSVATTAKPSTRSLQQTSTIEPPAPTNQSLLTVVTNSSKRITEGPFSVDVNNNQSLRNVNVSLEKTYSSTPKDNIVRVQVDVSCRKKKQKNIGGWLLVIVITGPAVVFVFALGFLFAVVRHKRKNGVWFTGLFVFCSCRQRQQLPKIEIYRHSMGTDSPDILHMEDFKNTKVVDLQIHRGRFVAKKAAAKAVTFKDQC